MDYNKANTGGYITKPEKEHYQGWGMKKPGRLWRSETWKLRGEQCKKSNIVSLGSHKEHGNWQKLVTRLGEKNKEEKKA